MASYTAPGVYIKDQVSGAQTISQASSSIGAMIGYTKSGPTDVAYKVGSWSEFIQKYANGLETPFTKGDYLAYAVYGFFQNGGKELYIASLKSDDAVKAKITLGDTSIVVTAKYAGAWANGMTFAIAQSKDYDAEDNLEFDVTVSIPEGDSVTVTGCYLADLASKVLASEAGNWIGSVEIPSSVIALSTVTGTLAGGSDGTTLSNKDYIAAIEDKLSVIDDVTMVAIPGQTSNVINDALISYCDNHGLFPMLDMPIGSTPEATKAYRKSISAFTGSLTYPWIKIYDPLTEGNITVPTVGHVMGVYARTIEARGVAKAPAGVDAVVRGALEMETVLTPANISTLNPIGVICICSRPNAGIVLWGARSLNSKDSTMRYVSDGLLNLNIKRSIYNGTQYAVFEPNNETLWRSVETTCKSFLENLRTEGCLKGDADEAYFVTVDSSNNTDYTIAEGQLIIDIGYAPVKPAEFVIFRLAHSIVSSES